MGPKKKLLGGTAEKRGHTMKHNGFRRLSPRFKNPRGGKTAKPDTEGEEHPLRVAEKARGGEKNCL